MLEVHQLVRIFCEMDDFCKQLENYTKDYSLPAPTKLRTGPRCCLDESEIMSLLILFQMTRFRDFKTFYSFAKQYWNIYFPNMPSYQRFIELMKRVIFPMTLFIQIKQGKDTGIYYIDSSCLAVCHIKRSKQHKTFEGIANYGKTSVGWFFGLKIHIVINDKGELMAFKITKGERHDSQVAEKLLGFARGLAFGDKGYISKKIFDALLKKGLKLITRKRKNMKNSYQIDGYEKQLLNQRNLVETVIEHLKHHYQVWHTRHRSIWNALTHLVSALAAYAIAPLKLSAIKLLARTPS